MNGSEYDYFVIVTRRGRLWSWEILRRSTPLGVRFCGDEFATPSAAKDAGQKALQDFLNSLARDLAGRPEIELKRHRFVEVATDQYMGVHALETRLLIARDLELLRHHLRLRH